MSYPLLEIEDKKNTDWKFKLAQGDEGYHIEIYNLIENVYVKFILDDEAIIDLWLMLDKIVREINE